MREVIRDPDGEFACPRCGRPVRYKGRGRRPIWCSSQCRVEASIERKGNRLAGVQPEVVRVLAPQKALSAWEVEQRERLARELPGEVAAAKVASDPWLLSKALERVLEDQVATDERRQIATAELLRRAADQLSPQTELPAAATEDRRPGQRRDAAEWATLLDELGALLGNGQFYNRDLPALYEPLRQVVQKFDSRRSEWGRF